MHMQTKSCEPDTLQIKFVKEHLDTLQPIITKIVNLSLINGIFAKDWKVAILQLLLKELGLQLVESNYRPVSYLPFISKLVEKVSIQQLERHCDSNGTTSNHQSAYKVNHSHETSILKLVNDLLWCMEKEDVNILVVVDLSLVFDTVDHNILLKTWQYTYGVEKLPLNGLTVI